MLAAVVGGALALGIVRSEALGWRSGAVWGSIAAGVVALALRGILRRVVRNAYIGRPMGDLSSMENPRSIDEVIGLRAARV